jgi:predicted house-cleaning noncanonical NTP pyrophosphatase (MazG superfamily)
MIKQKHSATKEIDQLIDSFEIVNKGLKNSPMSKMFLLEKVRRSTNKLVEYKNQLEQQVAHEVNEYCKAKDLPSKK